MSKSSTEGEYRALAHAFYEILWFINVLTDLGVNLQTHISLFCDNKSAVDLTTNPVYHDRKKHIKLDCHSGENKVWFEYCLSDFNFKEHCKYVHKRS